MATYPGLASLLKIATSNSSFTYEEQVIPYLVDVWLWNYKSIAARSDIVETTIEHCSYLFDIAAERLISAWGISKGRHSEPRDKSRMAGHPLSAGSRYHRGHAIPHTLGGPADINLVPQSASVNIGPFRTLEKRAVATPGSLYFSYWTYRPQSSQRPIAVDQGILIPGQLPDIRTHAN